MDISIFIRLLLILFFALVGIQSSVSSPQAVEEQVIPVSTVIPDFGSQSMDTVRSLTVVENVEPLLMESYPVQISLEISGYQPDGCEAPVNVAQRREGNEVYVEIYRELPPDVMCPMILLPYNETIRIDGGFESGSYTFNVNGYTLQVTI